MPAEIWKDREVAKAFLDERSLIIPDRERQLDVLLRVVRFHSPQPRRILDIGTGDGILLGTLLETFPDATGQGVDFSPLMLEMAGQRLGRFGARANTVEADLQNVGWQDLVKRPFDVIVSGFAIHHLPDERKRTLYQEIFDLLAEGGVFLNCEHVASPTPNIERMFDDAMTEHLYHRRKEKGEDVSLEQMRRNFMERHDRAANILALVDDQCRWLREIGFQEVDCFWKYFELAIFGGIKARVYKEPVVSKPRTSATGACVQPPVAHAHGSPVGAGNRQRVSPTCSSIRESRLYLAILSPRATEPILICPALVPTARSAMVVSSVSPLRAETTVR